MYTQIVIISMSVLVGIGIWRYAYRLGVRHGRAMSVPFRLIDELLDHKIHCYEQEPSTARLELETVLGVEAWESQPLLQHVLHSSRQRRGDNTTVDLSSPPRTKKVA